MICVEFRLPFDHSRRLQFPQRVFVLR